ncbi:hypothetical protein RFI_00530 [Reticulomyxa filosa]|uniref:Uncharacterized protein n=1 Tax=Reticulomyxa filosa TaxID=46433 RepID=X6PEK1_RETFI|nr:hypothetical protein RFI_00530 [Reticulomyxa filosa]|eukprot:ETO36533.1 hypothetical protein RFI_00530 [Reticulomyxa filosa]
MDKTNASMWDRVCNKKEHGMTKWVHMVQGTIEILMVIFLTYLFLKPVLAMTQNMDEHLHTKLGKRNQSQKKQPLTYPNSTMLRSSSQLPFSQCNDRNEEEHSKQQPECYNPPPLSSSQLQSKPHPVISSSSPSSNPNGGAKLENPKDNDVPITFPSDERPSVWQSLCFSLPLIRCSNAHNTYTFM